MNENHFSVKIAKMNWSTGTVMPILELSLFSHIEPSSWLCINVKPIVDSFWEKKSYQRVNNFLDCGMTKTFI
jgi:hypothetical protein